MSTNFDDLVFKLDEIYSPTRPIKTNELFFGRREQLTTIDSAVREAGQHIVLYGDRGIGKTSLSNIVSLQYARAACCAVTCNQGSTLYGLWKQALRRIPAAMEHFKRVGFEPSDGQQELVKSVVTLADQLEGKREVNVDTINELLESANSLGFKIIFTFDEFDQLQFPEVLADFSNIIKFCSDRLENITIMIVGIGKSVTDLIANHQSIERSVKQILLQRMSDPELTEIVQKANVELGMTIEGTTLTKIVKYSAGYPHYTHLLGKYASKSALGRNSMKIEDADLDTAVDEAIRNANESIRKSYETATITTKGYSNFPAVLTACAIVSTDEHGTFGLSDLKPVLKNSLGLDIDVQGYQYHIGKFSSDERGNVLERVSVGCGSRYKFSNPLFKTYVFLRHLRSRKQKK